MRVIGFDAYRVGEARGGGAEGLYRAGLGSQTGGVLPFKVDEDEPRHCYSPCLHLVTFGDIKAALIWG